MTGPLREVIFFGQGQVAAFDAERQQVAEWQVNSYFRTLAEMDRAGVLADDTRIRLHGCEDAPTWRAFRERYGHWFAFPAQEEER